MTHIGPVQQMYRQNFEFLKIQDGGGRYLEKSQKIAISPQRFDRSIRNLESWCKIGPLTSTVKKIQISQIQDGGHLPF